MTEAKQPAEGKKSEVKKKIHWTQDPKNKERLSAIRAKAARSLKRNTLARKQAKRGVAYAKGGEKMWILYILNAEQERVIKAVADAFGVVVRNLTVSDQ